MDVQGFNEEHLVQINGVYTFFKMYENRPVYKNETAGTFFQYLSSGGVWIISNKDFSSNPRERYCIHAYIRGTRSVENPLECKGTWNCVSGPLNGRHQQFTKRCNISIDSMTRTNARGARLSAYKPGVYNLKGLLPVYDTYKQIGGVHSEMLPRHCEITVFGIYANTEDFTTNVVYGKIDKGYIPLGEYHGKKFADRVRDLPIPETEEPQQPVQEESSAIQPQTAPSIVISQQEAQRNR
jgi:hypothetical protein